ncbi:hypothetical protein CROQUDRAFT_476823 [Cronartium quercuum f. sp. fusiforme G11]|uniref:Uncharacterized protein n=1 Tax=Cronartium quercuum f. sp. fusiforme G11 TaxID=708437 RepID=A0A9P6NNF6_9BASI|nr:hypothetical protein CROQUDRAFT_476823 [Cronartium quercuum f. sp. fusiforme G11]
MEIKINTSDLRSDTTKNKSICNTQEDVVLENKLKFSQGTTTSHRLIDLSCWFDEEMEKIHSSVPFGIFD